MVAVPLCALLPSTSILLQIKSISARTQERLWVATPTRSIVTERGEVEYVLVLIFPQPPKLRSGSPACMDPSRIVAKSPCGASLCFPQSFLVVSSRMLMSLTVYLRPFLTSIALQERLPACDHEAILCGGAPRTSYALRTDPTREALRTEVRV